MTAALIALAWLALALLVANIVGRRLRRNAPAAERRVAVPEGHRSGAALGGMTDQINAQSHPAPGSTWIPTPGRFED